MRFPGPEKWSSPKPYNFIGFEAADVTILNNFIRLGDINGPSRYKLHRFWRHLRNVVSRLSTGLIWVIRGLSRVISKRKGCGRNAQLISYLQPDLGPLYPTLGPALSRCTPLSCRRQETTALPLYLGRTKSVRVYLRLLNHASGRSGILVCPDFAGVGVCFSSSAHTYNDMHDF